MQKIHVLGIGGSGASAIAAIAQSQGYTITGCDNYPDNEFTKVFESRQIFSGHSPKHLDGVDILVITPAILSLDPRNPELKEAKKQGIPILTWQQFMGEYLEKDKYVIAVCGTHGKSTTTAMIGLMLEEAGLDPTVELGAIVPKWRANYRIGDGKYFVTEADEFNDNFLVTKPDITVVTTIEMDHPEYFADFKAYKRSFDTFLSKTKRVIIANLSDMGVKEVLSTQSESFPGEVIDYSSQLINFPLQIIGQHNIMNASAVYQVGQTLGINPETITKSLSSFRSIGRRFEYLGNNQGMKVYSDFGHHPTEIKVTLETARQQFPDMQIIAVFQPHMFSRTKALFNDFVNVLRNLPVNKTYIMDIYPSREVDTGLVNSKQLAIEAASNKVEYISNTNQLFQKLNTATKQNSVVFFIGAGDTDKWAREFVIDTQETINESQTDSQT